MVRRRRKNEAGGKGKQLREARNEKQGGAVSRGLCCDSLMTRDSGAAGRYTGLLLIHVKRRANAETVGWEGGGTRRVPSDEDKGKFTEPRRGDEGTPRSKRT